MQAEIVRISRDAVADKKQGLVYPSRVRLKTAWIDVNGRKTAIAPGMISSVEIRTGERQVIQFLLSPLLRYCGEAMRER